MDLLISVRPVMNAQDTTDNIPVHVNAESQGDLCGNAGTTPGGITPFHGNHGVDKLLGWSFRPLVDRRIGAKTGGGTFVRQHRVKISKVDGFRVMAVRTIRARRMKRLHKPGK